MADFHLDFFQYMLKKRRDDFSAALHQCMHSILDEHKKQRVDFICISGDVFHAKHPSFKAIEEFKYFVDLMEENGIKIIGVTGNHDHTSYPWMEFFKVFGGSSSVVRFDHTTIYKVNWSLGIIDQCLAVVKDVDRNKFNILMVHHGIDKYFGKVTKQAIDHFSNSGIDYIALGHIHVPYKYSIAHNPGSLEYTSSTDWGNPGGMFVVDVLDGTVNVKHVPTYHRPCFKINHRDSIKTLPKAIEALRLPQDSLLEVELQVDIGLGKLNDLEKQIKERWGLLRVKVKNNIPGADVVAGDKPVSEDDAFSDVFKGDAVVVKEVIINRDNPEKVAELLDDH